jgi:hypothetical protein
MSDKTHESLRSSSFVGDNGSEATDATGPVVPNPAAAEDPRHTKTTPADSAQQSRNDYHTISYQTTTKYGSNELGHNLVSSDKATSTAATHVCIPQRHNTSVAWHSCTVATQ